MKKVKIRLNFHSIVDIITNSSSEIFCRIKSAEHMKEVEELLSEVLGRRVTVDDYDDEEDNSIDFRIEWGDNGTVASDFVSMVKYILTTKLGEGTFEIIDDVEY